MLDGPNRVAALVFHPHSGIPRPAVGMIANDDSNESHSVLSPSPEQQGNVYRLPRARIISIHLRIHPVRPRDWTLTNLLQTPLVVDIGSRRIRPE